jgi:hypothetical protein
MKNRKVPKKSAAAALPSLDILALGLISSWPRRSTQGENPTAPLPDPYPYARRLLIPSHLLLPCSGVLLCSSPASLTEHPLAQLLAILRPRSRPVQCASVDGRRLPGVGFELPPSTPSSQQRVSLFLDVSSMVAAPSLFLASTAASLDRSCSPPWRLGGSPSSLKLFPMAPSLGCSLCRGVSCAPSHFFLLPQLAPCSPRALESSLHRTVKLPWRPASLPTGAPWSPCFLSCSACFPCRVLPQLPRRGSCSRACSFPEDFPPWRPCFFFFPARSSFFLCLPRASLSARFSLPPLLSHGAPWSLLLSLSAHPQAASWSLSSSSSTLVQATRSLPRAMELSASRVVLLFSPRSDSVSLRALSDSVSLTHPLPNPWSRSRLAATAAPTTATDLLPCARSASLPSSSLCTEVACSSCPARLLLPVPRV